MKNILLPVIMISGLVLTSQAYAHQGKKSTQPSYHESTSLHHKKGQSASQSRHHKKDTEYKRTHHHYGHDKKDGQSKWWTEKRQADVDFTRTTNFIAGTEDLNGDAPILEKAGVKRLFSLDPDHALTQLDAFTPQLLQAAYGEIETPADLETIVHKLVDEDFIGKLTLYGGGTAADLLIKEKREKIVQWKLSSYAVRFQSFYTNLKAKVVATPALKTDGGAINSLNSLADKIDAFLDQAWADHMVIPHVDASMLQASTESTQAATMSKNIEIEEKDGSKHIAAVAVPKQTELPDVVAFVQKKAEADRKVAAEAAKKASEEARKVKEIADQQAALELAKKAGNGQKIKEIQDALSAKEKALNAEHLAAATAQQQAEAKAKEAEAKDKIAIAEAVAKSTIAAETAKQSTADAIQVAVAEAQVVAEKAATEKVAPEKSEAEKIQYEKKMEAVYTVAAVHASSPANSSTSGQSEHQTHPEDTATIDPVVAPVVMAPDVLDMSDSQLSSMSKEQVQAISEADLLKLSPEEIAQIYDLLSDEQKAILQTETTSKK